MQATYTLAYLKDAEPNSDERHHRPQTGYVRYDPLPFPTAKDLGGWYTYSVADQRHRATVNGVWQLPHRFQLSGLYFYGSGMRFATAFQRRRAQPRHVRRQPVQPDDRTD
jgi:hypothetical protein